jgi:hydroxyacylglutathione hydrolase
MFFKQIKIHRDNFSYIIADQETKQAAIVDPGFNAEEIKNIVSKENLTPIYILNTHDHIDHTLGVEELRLRYSAKTVGHPQSKTPLDLKIAEGEQIQFGNVSMEVIYTPGHSLDSVCFLVNGKKLLTGDTLFVGDVGSASLPGGDFQSMYESLFKKIVTLEDDIEVYPGHDCGTKPSSTIGEEKRFNYALKPRKVEEFIEFMKLP